MNTWVTAWIVSAIVLIGLLGLVGSSIRKHVLGVLVDSRNKISLSRFQLVLWTVVIVSAFFAMAWFHSTMDIYLPPEIWALMGISTASGAGAVIVKGTKSGKEPSGPTAQALTVRRMGLLTIADKPRFTDMFKGEEITDAAHVDIAKIQLFFFTIATVLGYIMALYAHDFTEAPTGFDETYRVYFPTLSASLVTLSGISHAGYLTMKAAPHTPSN